MTKVLLLVSLLFSAATFANTVSLPFTQVDVKSNTSYDKASVDPDFFTIQEVELTELRSSNWIDNINEATTGVGSVIGLVDKLIALGKKVWPLVEAGRPVINTNFADYISVIPHLDGTDALFNEVTGWSAPKSQKFEVVYKNVYGMKVVKFVFSVNAQYGGEYEGKGQYLTGVTIVPNSIEVAWGFDFDAKSQVVNITNRGSKDDPIAAVNLEVAYVVKTVVKESRVKAQFHVAGNGEMLQIN